MNIKVNAKAWVAAVGTAITSAAVMWATVTNVVADDAVDAAEIGSLASAVVAFAGTVYGVWKAENARKTP